MNSRFRKKIIGMFFIVFVAFYCGCVPEFTDETPLAMVENEPVTYGEFKRELQMFHLTKSDKAKTGEIDIKEFMDRLIRKRLFIQEAMRMGLGQGPDIDAAVDSELKKQALILLHKEEIDDKIAVSDEEAWEGYKKILDKRRVEVEEIRGKFSINPDGRHKTVSDYLSRLRKGSKIEIDPNFVWLGDEYCDPNLPVARINDVMIMCRDISSAINTLNNESGETKGWETALHGLIDQSLLDQEIGRLLPSKESFEKSKERIKKGMIKDLRQEREAEYLEELRQKARISKFDIDPERILDESSDPNQQVISVNDKSITLRDLKSAINLKELTSARQETRQKIIENNLRYLVDCILVDQEALGRGYEKLPAVHDSIKAVKEKIIYNKFFNNLLLPSIKTTDEDVETYYSGHPEIFRTPVNVKVEEIRLKTQEEADKIMTDLKSGSDFNFLSQQSLPERITSIHWISVNRFPENIKDGLMKTREGELFGPASWNEGYSIFLLKRISGGEPVPFERAKKEAENMLKKELFNQAVEKWDAALRATSNIVIYEDRLKAILAGIGEGNA
ncbi:peptidyl-prolyl cis-trans isomerase [bacterium]|nr:peptidyl-prolyl cis-trans isomerase [bacterium]